MKHNIHRLPQWSTCCCLIGALFAAPATLAQNTVWIGSPGTPATWNNDLNWLGDDGNFMPDGSLGEAAIIDNGGIAYVDSTFFGFLLPGRIDVGVGSGASGGLEIRNGGLMDTDTSGGQNGGVFVGTAGGSGALTVEPSGELMGSSIAFGGGASFTQQITSSGQTVRVNVDSIATLDGLLNVDFSSFTPVIGNSFPLIEANSIAGAFGAVNVTGAGGLPMQLVTAPTGVGTREALILSFNATLSLLVDRNTGNVSIRNTMTHGVDFDGYTIASPGGSLDASPGSFTGLTAIDPAWAKSAASDSNRLTETQLVGATTLTNDSLSIGNVFGRENLQEFGVNPDDLTFTYVNPDGNEVDGPVEYIGDTWHNNLILRVDPATGAAQIDNRSSFTVEIDAYTITSLDESLLLNSWAGLEGNPAAEAGWDQSAASDSERLTETILTSEQLFESGTILNVGTLMSTPAADPDLAFEYLFPTENTSRLGVVVYEALLPENPPGGGLAGDFDGDDDVDGADLLLWQRGFGTTYETNDLADWQANFGTVNAAGVSASAVPEPASALLVLLSTVLLTGLRPRRRESESPL